MEDLFNRRRRASPPPGPLPSQAPVQRPRSLLNDPNWGLATPQDIVNEYMSKDVMKMPQYGADGRERSSMSAMERYYDRQNNQKYAAPNSSGASFNPGNLFGNNGGSGSGGISSPATMSGFSNPNLNGSSVRPEVLSDLMGLRNNPMSPAAIHERESHQRQMEAFKRALDYNPTASAPQSTANSPSSRGSTWNGGNGNFNPVMPRNPFDPVAGTYNPSLPTTAPIAPIGPAAPHAPTHSLSSMLPTSPSRSAPSKKDFSIPQRPF
ncbi:MAG: hypothetical protein H7Y43_18350 [Akkermansiaceae bacterium]|nr:hypothetical protein [Verrucomicrobiales bacterium]